MIALHSLVKALVKTVTLMEQHSEKNINKLNVVSLQRREDEERRMRELWLSVVI